MRRNANGRSSIYEGGDGWWHGRVTVGIKDDGRPDRRHVMAKTKAGVTAKVRKLEKLRGEGRVPKAGQRYRVETWLTYWVQNIAAPPNISENAHSGYEVDVRVHLIPGIGAHWLDNLEAEYLEKLYAKMIRGGSAPGTAHHVHRTIRNALNEAPGAAGISRRTRRCSPRRPGSPMMRPSPIPSSRCGGCWLWWLTAATGRGGWSRWPSGYGRVRR